jgi:hypothetical protein
MGKEQRMEREEEGGGNEKLALKDSEKEKYF